MSHTIYAAKFKQTIIHQHVHLRRESQSRAPAHALMRVYQSINRSFGYKAKEGRHVRIMYISSLMLKRYDLQGYYNNHMQDCH
jgi:hypothetical protein